MFFESLMLNLTKLINYIVPKDSKQIFFYSFPDYSDNARALFEKLYFQKGQIYRYVWAVRDVEKYKTILPPEVKIVKHRSFNNFWHFCRSKYIIRTHSLWGNKYIKGRQIMCVAWHGMAMKEDSLPEAVSCDFLTATSSLFQEKLSKDMWLKNDECKITGLPRNDRMLIKSDVLNKMGFDCFDKVIIWMPTYRVGFGNKDGVDSTLGLPTVPPDGLDSINNILKEKNYLLLLRLHPISQDKLKGLDYSNIKTLRNEDIPIQYTPYEIIGKTDALITDYSSVSVDYLLIDKPICFVVDDIEEYRATRGFPFEPIEEYMPGAKIKTFDELIQWFNSFDGTDSYSEDRERVRRLFHKFPDGRSTERVLEQIGLI